MKATCKGCKQELDETELTQIYERSYQKDYCMACYGEKIADLVHFTREFSKDCADIASAKITSFLALRHHQPIRNFLKRMVQKRFYKQRGNMLFDDIFALVWSGNRHMFDSLIEACIMDQCVGCDERK